MDAISNLLYSNDDFIVIRTPFPKNRQFKVISSDYKVHSHLRSKKEAIDLANYAKYNKIPQSAKIDYLISLSRLIRDPSTSEKLEELIKVKKNRKSSRKYININKGKV